MAYSVKIIVHAADEPNVLQLVRKAVESKGVEVREITLRPADKVTKEVYVDLLLEDSRVIGTIIRRIEGVRGAAVMASKEPRPIQPPGRGGR